MGQSWRRQRSLQLPDGGLCRRPGEAEESRRTWGIGENIPGLGPGEETSEKECNDIFLRQCGSLTPWREKHIEKSFG